MSNSFPDSHPWVYPAGGFDIRAARFEFVTRWRWVWVPEGEHRGLQTFTAHGHAAIIDGLRDGDVVTLDISLPDGTFTYTVNVR